ncbi:MAG: ABC transporter ATP-binding protein [Planctomycetota bacterium]|nr:ABC transporter ATP-binding protein [Planctomycetota bacterium]
MEAANAADAVLEVEGLTKRFESGDQIIEAVRDVSLTLSRGEFTAVMGPSGSGKSTLLHLVAGLTRPDAGRVRIEGTDIFALSDYRRTVFRRERVGLIFQAFNLIPSLTAEENILLPLLLGKRDPVADEVERLISCLGLNDVRRRRPDSMSGGEQQRVAIARALATGPSLILADEPTGSLDTINGRKLCETFRRLCGGGRTAVLMVTHNPAVAFFAERIVFMRDGRVVCRVERREFPSVQDLSRYYVSLLESEPQEVAR